MRQQATEISNATLDAALFDVPSGYTQAKSYQDLMGRTGGVQAGGMGAVPNPESMPGRTDEQRKQIAEAQKEAMDAQGQSSSQATGAAAAGAAMAGKKAGTLRVGVLRVVGETNGVQSDLRAALVSEIRSLGTDA